MGGHTWGHLAAADGDTASTHGRRGTPALFVTVTTGKLAYDTREPRLSFSELSDLSSIVTASSTVAVALCQMQSGPSKAKDSQFSAPMAGGQVTLLFSTGGAL